MLLLMVGKNIKFFLPTGFVRISATEQVAAKCELSSLNIKSLMGWTVKGEMDCSRVLVKLLEANMGGRKKGNYYFIFPITALTLCEERVRSRSVRFPGRRLQ